MDWKEFLQPSWAKLIVFAVIAFVLVPVMVFALAVDHRVSQYLDPIYFPIFLILTWLSILFSLFNPNLVPLSVFQWTALGLALSYLISCTAIFLKKRIQKK